MLAVTPEGDLLLVEQERIPVGAPVLELPAGLVGDLPGEEGEPLERAAARELEEETGYRPTHVRQCARGPVSAGLTSEIVTFFVASGLVRVSAGGGDATENITVHAIPLPEVPAFLEAYAAAGGLVDPKIYAGLWLLSAAPGGSGAGADERAAVGGARESHRS